MPKPAARFPVVAYFYDSGGSLAACEQVLRHTAELGCAAVAFEYDQRSQLHFNEQVRALHEDLKHQRWAQSNGVAWVGFGLGAQRSLSLMLAHPEVRPQLYVRVGGGMVEGLVEPRAGDRESRAEASRTPPVMRGLTRVTWQALLVHGERDGVFPVSCCQRVAGILATNGVHVETRVLPGLQHDLGAEAGVVMRGVAEYCAANLPVADYAGGVAGCALTEAEKGRFNLAMARAGRHRRELWKAVVSSHEPERRTLMMVVGGLEDYDLAHISASHLRELVKVAWEARRTFPWCRDTPVGVFEKYISAPRAFEEPLGRFQSSLHSRLRQQVKYCRSIGEVSDAVGKWERLRAVWKDSLAPEDPTPAEVLSSRGGDCQQLISLFIYLARSVGVAVRPVVTTWPTLGTSHYWAEIWDVDNNAWHSFDGSTADRPYKFDWVMNVPKAATHAASGERGAWNAAREDRWEAYTNTVGLFYPSGTVLVRVLEHDAPRANQRVDVHVWLARGAMVHLTSAQTDGRGEVRFTLGQSARRPYRFVLAGSDEGDWEWLAVQAGGHYDLTLHADRTKAFDPAAKPPPLGFPEWEKKGSAPKGP